MSSGRKALRKGRMLQNSSICSLLMSSMISYIQDILSSLCSL